MKAHTYICAYICVCLCVHMCVKERGCVVLWVCALVCVRAYVRLYVCALSVGRSGSSLEKNSSAEPICRPSRGAHGVPAAPRSGSQECALVSALSLGSAA